MLVGKSGKIIALFMKEDYYGWPFKETLFLGDWGDTFILDDKHISLYRIVCPD